MTHSAPIIMASCFFFLTGCAGLDFGKDKSGEERGLIYFEPVPYLFVSTSKDCVTAAAVTIIPGKQRELKFKWGYGSYELSASLSNAMISAVGQKADSKIPETLSAIGNIAGAVKPMFAEGPAVVCQPTATLYPINAEGEPDLRKPIKVPTPEAKPVP